jgi:hypothetical protein
MKNLRTVQTRLQSTLESIENDITHAKNKLETDFTYNFEWGYSDELYKLICRKKYLQQILTEMENVNVSAVLNHHIDNLTKKILSGNFGTSSLSSSNNAQTLRNQTDCKILSYLKDLQEYNSDNNN